jgi:cytoskeleton protein RodZ
MGEGIGARLRGARERSRLTILQAAERLHVDPDILEALEADNFAALGAPVYVKGHLRHYAELVGEPVQPLFELYAQGTRVPPPDLTRIPRLASDGAGRLVAPAILVIAVFASAGAVWWILSLSHQHGGPQAVPVAARAAAAPIQQGQPGAAVLAVASASAATVVPSAAVQGQIDATLKYSTNSWTEVYDATGRRLLYGLATGPATRRLRGVPPLTVVLGDAGAVTLEIGGRPASIAGFVHSDHTARFLIAADGRVLAAPPKKGI